MNKAIFMDRDGVINKLPHKYPNDGIGDIRNYITKWEDFEFLDGVTEAFDLIKESEYMPIVVSNQGGAIGRGLVKHNAIKYIFNRMKCEIIANSGPLSHYYFCPHLIADNCACIKPKPGMLYKAAIEHDIDLSQSWMIGDNIIDMQAGIAAGTKNIGIGNSIEDFRGGQVRVVKPSFLEAVQYILKMDAYPYAPKTP